MGKTQGHMLTLEMSQAPETSPASCRKALGLEALASRALTPHQVQPQVQRGKPSVDDEISPWFRIRADMELCFVIFRFGVMQLSGKHD